jgi:hypothetical protein
MSHTAEVSRVEEARELHQRITEVVASGLGYESTDPEASLNVAHAVIVIGLGEKLSEGDGSIDFEPFALSYNALRNRIKNSNASKPETALRGWKEKLRYSFSSHSPEKAATNRNVLRWRIVAPLLKQPITEEELAEAAQSS